ncbi:class I SAM-dependent methyltransferase [Pseudogemmobacter bohemicus]|uniref:class I SAM-dependent methyltransferase n=1 Tax=Pseudogemmobacter bohemicus TaxID=2250708 RepID=UPI000DD371E1|nr:class I SAM-dependent methyltransferase [Pseudogemmobacter bohemicus]
MSDQSTSEGDKQRRKEEKKEGKFARARAAAEASAGGQLELRDGYALYQYPDYDTYREVQSQGNKAKLKAQFVRESHIQLLADIVLKNAPEPDFGLCHGTRRGAEQSWFRTHLGSKARVIGTEISDTATQFPDTLQWDFHDENPDWESRADFVYSNSWDHAFDPLKAFGAWIKSLKPGGLLLLDHTRGHSPKTADALDPFGISLEKLISMITEAFGDQGEIQPVFDSGKVNPEYAASVVIFRKNG